MTKRLPNIQVRRQRWLEFADFMEALPEHKFSHSRWCTPDHTCKTTACVAGWGAIQYSDRVKAWIKAEFAYQATRKRFKRLRSDTSISKCREELRKIEEEVNDNSYFEWAEEGKKVLYLSNEVTEKLFYPYDSFWKAHGGKIYATNKDIALIFRYLATLPVRNISLPPTFNPEHMQIVVSGHFKKEV